MAETDRFGEGHGDVVEHFVEGRGAWKAGTSGFWARYRGILSGLVLTAITMGTPIWWPTDFFDKTFKVSVLYAFSLSILVVGLAAAAVLYRWRVESIRELDLAWYLHELADFLRDGHAQSCSHALPGGVNAGMEVETERLRKYAADLCERVKDYLVRLIGDGTLEVALRLAVDKQSAVGRSSVVFATIGRTSGLSRARQRTTEDLPANEGIARFFSQRYDSRGVLLYHDLEKAEQMDLYRRTENDRTYSSEIETMMVAPLNAWDGSKVRTIGLLYVTSRGKNTFKAKHVDSIRFFADTTAYALAHVVACLRHSDRMPSLAREDS